MDQSLRNTGYNFVLFKQSIRKYGDEKALHTVNTERRSLCFDMLQDQTLLHWFCLTQETC